MDSSRFLPPILPPTNTYYYNHSDCLKIGQASSATANKTVMRHIASSTVQCIEPPASSNLVAFHTPDHLTKVDALVSVIKRKSSLNVNCFSRTQKYHLSILCGFPGSVGQVKSQKQPHKCVTRHNYRNHYLFRDITNDHPAETSAQLPGTQCS